MGNCFFCSADIATDTKIYRSSECPCCSRALKICKNCRFYAPGSHWDCKETIPEAVREKEEANFCDYFSFSGEGGNRGAVDEKSQEARKKFDSLFD